MWVAGSVGPLGTRIEPLGKTSFEEARQAFREQIAVSYTHLDVYKRQAWTHYYGTDSRRDAAGGAMLDTL